MLFPMATNQLLKVVKCCYHLKNLGHQHCTRYGLQIQTNLERLLNPTSSTSAISDAKEVRCNCVATIWSCYRCQLSGFSAVNNG